MLTYRDTNNNVIDYLSGKYRDMHVDWGIIGETNTGPIYSTTSGTVYFS